MAKGGRVRVRWVVGRVSGGGSVAQLTVEGAGGRGADKSCGSGCRCEW